MRITFTVLLALFVLATPTVRAQGASDAVKEFRRYFRTYKETSEKVEAVRTLRSHDNAEAAQELMTLLDHKEEPIRAAAIDVLSGFRDPKTFEAVVAELPNVKQNDRKALVIGVLGRSKVEAVVPVLTKLATEDKKIDGQVRAAIARAFADLGVKTAGPILTTFLGDKDPMVRMAAADAARALQDRSVGPALLPLIDDAAWQVQSAAVQAAGVLRIVEAIDPLIAVMRGGGRLKEEAAEALFRITAMDLPADPDEWSRLLGKLRDAGWRPPTDEELAKAIEARKKTDAFYGKQSDKTTFGGITTTSTRVLFIVDVSGSMEDRVIEIEKFQSGYANLQKLTIVKTELARTVESLGPDVFFNIVAFASKLSTFKSDLVPANIVMKSAAKNWIDKLQPIGGSEAQAAAAVGMSATANLEAGKTNTYAALMYPFGIDPEKPPPPTTPGAIKNKLDTVFFLSDGRPSVGRLVDTNEIRKVVTKINETYRIVFHCIAIGEFQKEFMGDLSRENGGVFVDLGR